MANKRELETFVLQQQQMLSMLKSMYASLEELVKQKDAEIARLNEIIRNLKRSLFGQKSEKTAYVLDGQPMLPFETPESKQSEPEKVQTLQPAPVQVPIQAHHRTKRTLEERVKDLPVIEEAGLPHLLFSLK